MSERDELAALRVLNVELQEVTGKVMHDLVGMRAERDALRAQVARLRDGLNGIVTENLEADEGTVLCRVCEVDGYDQHASECPIAKLIALAASPPGPDPAGGA